VRSFVVAEGSRDKSAHSYKIADGSVRFIGSVVDVSELKRLELLQLEASEQRAAEALAMRQALELSVDVTSHELRNPLSGVIQAAELLALHLERIVALADRNLADGRITEAHHAAVMDQLSACEESVETIQLCSKHQRRVADDILKCGVIARVYVEHRI
jgi:signal transduction histidine kinase